MDEVQSTSQDHRGLECDRIPNHFLVELTSLDELAFPANSTKRVKYTCVASTSRSLILGTSTGTVYIFSRYAAKSRSRVNSPVPVHVFTTRDGQISTISLCSSEELMAIGGDSGRVSVAQMNNGQPPTLLYTIPGDARFPDKVTALAWSTDNKQVFSGHSSGNLQAHRLGSRSVFRASHQKLTKFESEITQMDVFQDQIIVATTMAAFLFNLENMTTQQIGKKPRTSPSHLGACYIRSPNGSGYIVAARPNGRVWESNLVGVVYRTHQFRQAVNVPRAPPVSFRSCFPTESSQFEGIHPENQDVMFNLLRILSVEEKPLVLSAFGARICIVDTDSSKIVITSELEHDILDVSTCGNDLFVLLNDSKGLRKYSLFERTKTIEKLHLKSLFMQAAQLVSFCYPFVEFSKNLISNTAEGLAGMSKKKETERLNQHLSKIQEEMEERRKASESQYDNNIEEKMEERKLSKKLPSGVHRVLRNVQESGYDDDFSFHTPQALRERSRSSPCGGIESSSQPDEILTSPTSISKRASEPSNLELKQEWRKNGTPDVVEEDILHRARIILDSDGQVVEKESLRTLLQLEGIKRDEIRFTPTITIGSAAKALAEMALAVPVDLSTIWKDNNMVEEEEDEDSGLESGRTEKNNKVVKTVRTPKATIVKVVRPGVKPKPVVNLKVRVAEKETDTVNNDTIEEVHSDHRVDKLDPVSEEMRRKQDELWLDLRLNHISQQNLEKEEKDDVKKSDTDYTLTTDRGDSATPTNEIWQNPLPEISQASSHQSSNSLKSEKLGTKSHCHDCGMHRSWAALALLMSVCGRAEVIQDDFRTGSVPASWQNWEALLKYVALRNVDKDEVDVSAICPRCETALSGIERVLADGWKNVGMAATETKVNVDKIHERCRSISNEKMRNIISRKVTDDSVSKSFEEKDTRSTETNPRLRQISSNDDENFVINIAKEVEVPSRFLKDEAYWSWTNGVRLKTLLALACFCEGKKKVLEIISSDDKFVGSRMIPEDWCTLVVMSSREVYSKNLLSDKTITVVLESFGAAEWVKPRKTAVARRSSASATTMSSWIVDTNGKCPICTLSIKMVVGGVDRGVVSYSCGHVYHKMCLTGRSSTGCLACRSRARRTAISRQSNTPNRSPIMPRAVL